MQMALAGFVYTPQSPADDTATCLYCNISLSGWEDDDDPLYAIVFSGIPLKLITRRNEHRKREKKIKTRCPFLSNWDTLSSAKTTTGRQLNAKDALESVTTTRAKFNVLEEAIPANGNKIARANRKAKEKVQPTKEPVYTSAEQALKDELSIAGPLNHDNFLPCHSAALSLSRN